MPPLDQMIDTRRGDRLVGPAISAPAMSVVSLRPAAGCQSPLRRWQVDLERAVATFAGYLGTEILTSAAGRHDRTIVHRFRSTTQLETWLGSGVRADLLDDGHNLLATPPMEQILVGAADHDCVAVVRSYRPDDADEAALLTWHQRTTATQRTFPGFRGSELLRPAPGAQDLWTVVYRFASPLHLEHWLASGESLRLAADGPVALGPPPAAGRWACLRAALRGRRRGVAG